MMNNNRKQLELAYSVLFALPSTPVLRYGDEIGMGDDLTLQERLSVRTPMQWSDDPQSGFTTNSKSVRPVIDESPYDYTTINVERQRNDESSLLQWTERMVRLRKSCPEISFGDWEIVDTGNNNVLTIKYQWNGKYLLVVHNFSDKESTVKLPADLKDQKFKNLLDNPNAQFNAIPNELQLAGYDYRWYQMSLEDE